MRSLSTEFASWASQGTTILKQSFIWASAVLAAPPEPCVTLYPTDLLFTNNHLFRKGIFFSLRH